MANVLIEGGVLVNEGRSFRGYLVVQGERIAEIGEGAYPREEFSGERIDARGMWVLPGVIDDQVHFREPGLTYKEDIFSGSRAAVAGGVTSFMDMPNTKPTTTTLELLEHKREVAASKSLINYSFYFGATNNNLRELRRVDPRTTCGVKVFMGSSTGNMLVDDQRVLSAIFAESPVLIATHCEDDSMIRTLTERYRHEYGDRVTPAMHAVIRSAEACYRSSARAVELADRYGSNLHVLHVSTERELSLFDAKAVGEKKITSEVCVHHLWFSEEDYTTKGNRIKWNPSVKSVADRAALRGGLLGGKVDVVATDHAPHTKEEKAKPYWECPSGGPLIQHSLVAMLELSKQGVLTPEQVVEKMCHAPAIRFSIRDRGFLRPGAYADIALVRQDDPWVVGPDNILYKCGWSPFEGTRFSHRVAYTLVNGRVVNRNGGIDESYRGEALEFLR